MSRNEFIGVKCFGLEIGRLSMDEHRKESSFQYNPDFLNSGRFLHLFPDTGVLKRVQPVQVFRQFNSDTFRGLPPMFADSLPDVFGDIIVKKWLELNDLSRQQIGVLDQLSYVADRGMGALEFFPAHDLPTNQPVDLSEIIADLKVLLQTNEVSGKNAINKQGLLNIFKIGSSAGGARPKVLLSEHKVTGELLPGDLNCSDDYDHYLIKLHLDEELGYNREVIEYSYYLVCEYLGINRTYSKLVDGQHFATIRFDRHAGGKKHVLTACGLTGWDFQLPNHSTYENLFELAFFLKVPQREIEELFFRMVFNVVFCNTDDHLKNHSFIYDEDRDAWNLSPAYDVTYSLNPLLNYKRTSRALSINNKRYGVTTKDLLQVADRFTIRNAKDMIQCTLNAVPYWVGVAEKLQLSDELIRSIQKDFCLVDME